MAAADAEFLARFEDCSLSLEEWRLHRSHLRAAYLYLRAHGLERAIERMRAGIRAFNASKGLPDALDTGYHETVTQGWLRLLHGLLRAHGPESDHEAFYARHSYLQSKMMLLAYYSRERIMTLEAERTFVEPDLAPFPAPPGVL